MAHDMEDELPRGTVIDTFIIQELLGEGGYGQIYEVLDRQTRSKLAMKLEYSNARKQGLEEEIKIMRALQNSPFFPQLFATGRTSSFRYFVMELFGPSIFSIQQELSAKLYSRYTSLHIAFHSLRCIKAMHTRGYIHRDIKPGNFLIRPNYRNPLVLIDFGLSRRYISKKTGLHRPAREAPGYIGTTRYASLHAHEQMELSRRDDLISWFYSLLEIVEGRTPWPGSANKEKAIRMKRRMQAEELCRHLPMQFIAIWELISALEYGDEPNYHQIKELIKESWSDIPLRNRKLDWASWPPEKWRNLTTLDMSMPDASGPPSTQIELDGERSCCICAVA
jgi:serine/threonine protein kinase